MLVYPTKSYDKCFLNAYPHAGLICAGIGTLI